MQASIKLPVEQPGMTSWSNHAHFLSIVSRNPDSAAWLYANYIQIELIRGLTGRDMVLNYSFPTTPEESCPWLTTRLVTKADALKTEGGLIPFLKQRVADQEYIYLFIDQFYIPVYRFYQQEHYQHDPMVFGYDDERQVFHVADFHLDTDGNPRYGVFEVSYRQFEQAVLQLSDEQDNLRGIELIRYNQAGQFEFDIWAVQHSLSDFLHATHTMPKQDTWLTTSVEAYGIRTYDYLIDSLLAVNAEQPLLDFRLFHVMNDHKSLMLERLKYMCDQGYITARHHEAYEKITKHFAHLRNLLIMFSLSNRMSLLPRCVDTLRIVMELERDILTGVVEEISSLTKSR